MPGDIGGIAVTEIGAHEGNQPAPSAKQDQQDAADRTLAASNPHVAAVPLNARVFFHHGIQLLRHASRTDCWAWLRLNRTLAAPHTRPQKIVTTFAQLAYDHRPRSTSARRTGGGSGSTGGPGPG